ncbi:hypothetical protein CEUSTIGMA_g1909.t1 [Chlamydomonas eustigma]|uniref:Uncharacterized protein n=1 Tax=Chlamydomonas eustigma TaxID=1157962 RepID=A0A250WVA0_9CHLO|nr:hypothetical protein CEUSTIGMA_g1909.t1 [Chlamydomonas eustigma]|eukprot:GAX74460.1 hypothetical protein CEUSTIGMA_g1909.t1 [Chlamydomonas eustigma]
MSKPEEDTDASKRMHDYLLTKQRRKEDYWLRKYGRQHQAPSALPPLKQPGGRQPMFQANGPIGSFPHHINPDRMHKASAVPYHPAVPLPPIKQSPSKESPADPALGMQKQSSARSGRNVGPAQIRQMAEADVATVTKAGVEASAFPSTAIEGVYSSAFLPLPPLAVASPPHRQVSPTALVVMEGRALGHGLNGGASGPILAHPSTLAAMASSSAVISMASEGALAAYHPAPSPQRSQPAHHPAVRNLQMELSVLKSIKGREDTLDRLRVACDKLDGSFGGVAPLVLTQTDPLIRLFYRLVGTLRQRTLDTIESIAAWQRKTGGNREPFIYYGTDYLLSMGADLKFLDQQAFLSTRLIQTKAVDDPFLLDVTPDGIPIEEATTCDLRRGGMRFSSEALRIRMARRVLSAYKDRLAAAHQATALLTAEEEDSSAAAAGERALQEFLKEQQQRKATESMEDGTTGTAVPEAFLAVQEQEAESGTVSEAVLPPPEQLEGGEIMLGTAFVETAELGGDEDCVRASHQEDTLVRPSQHQDPAGGEAVHDADNDHSKEGAAALPGTVVDGLEGAAALPGTIVDGLEGAAALPGTVVDGLEGAAALPGTVVDGLEGAAALPGTVVDGLSVETVGPIEGVENLVAPDEEAVTLLCNEEAVAEALLEGEHSNERQDDTLGQHVEGGVEDTTAAAAEDMEEGGVDDTTAAAEDMEEGGVDELLLSVLSEGEAVIDLDDGQFLDFLIGALVSSLEEPYVSSIKMGSFTVAGWEIDRQLDTLILGIEEVGGSGTNDSRYYVSDGTGQQYHVITGSSTVALAGKGSALAGRGAGSLSGWVVVEESTAADDMASMPLHGNNGEGIAAEEQVAISRLPGSIRATTEALTSSSSSPPPSSAEAVPPKTPSTDMDGRKGDMNAGPVIDLLVDDLISRLDQSRGVTPLAVSTTSTMTSTSSNHTLVTAV